MIPYSRGLVLDNANNYGIVKTETVFGFAPSKHDQYNEEMYNTTSPLQWIFASERFQRKPSDDETETSRALNPKASPRKAKSNKMKKKKKHLKRKGKGKCVLKVLKGKGHKLKRGKGGKYGAKKMMVPLILGLLAAKSVLIPIALKALAFMSAKGLMMGFFSTVMASVLSLKGMFEHHHGYQNRKDDAKTQVEIIQVPSKSEDHHFYDDNFKRGDVFPPAVIQNKRFKIISKEVVE